MLQVVIGAAFLTIYYHWGEIEYGSPWSMLALSFAGTVFAIFMQWGFLGVFMVQSILGVFFLVRHLMRPLKKNI